MTANSSVAWRQVICCFVVLAADSFIATGYSQVSVPLGQEFHSSRMLLMLAMTTVSGVTAVLSPLFGGLMDRTSLRTMMIAGAITIACGYAAISFANSFNTVLVIFGVLIAPANILIGPVPATVLLTRWFEARRGRALGIAISGIAMGSVIYPPVFQWMLGHFAWREAFQLMALLLLIVSLPAALLVVDRPNMVPATNAPAVAAAAVVPGASAQISVGAVLSMPSFWLIAALVATVLSGMIGMITNLVPVALDRGIKASDAALLISVYGLTGFAAKLGFAALADRLASKTLLLTSLIGFCCGMACLGQNAFGYAGIATGVGLVGLAGGLMVPLQSFLVPQVFGASSVGRAMGCLNMVTLCALLLAPPLVGRLSTVAGKGGTIFLGFAGLAIVAMLAVPYLRLQPREESAVGVMVKTVG